MINKNGTNNFGQLKKFCSDNGYELWIDLVYGRYGTDDISVTELLSIIEDPSFTYIKQNHWEKLQEACDRWHAVHEMLDKEKIDYKHKDYYKRFREWKLLYSITIVDKEKTFYKEWIRGTIDAITNLWVVDYKTSIRKNEKYKIQIAAYCRLSWLNNWYILYMNKKKFEFIEVENLKYYTDIWLELLEYKETILLFNKNKDG